MGTLHIAYVACVPSILLLLGIVISLKSQDKGQTVTTFESGHDITGQQRIDFSSANDLEDQNGEDVMPYIHFYKTHKTGSSSIQNVFMRLAMKKKYPILYWKPQPGNTHFSYPDPFRYENALNQKHTAKIALSHMNPADHNQLAHIFPRDSREDGRLFRTTILREPFGLFKSSFPYFFTACGGFKAAGTAKNFLDNVDRFSKMARWRWEGNKQYCFNHNAFDLGYQYENFDDKKDLRRVIQELDQRIGSFSRA